MSKFDPETEAQLREAFEFGAKGFSSFFFSFFFVLKFGEVVVFFVFFFPPPQTKIFMNLFSFIGCFRNANCQLAIPWPCNSIFGAKSIPKRTSKYNV